MNKVFNGLLIVTALVSVFFLGKASIGVWAYFSLDGKTKAFVEGWEVEEKDSSSYALLVSYHFFVGKEKVEGVTEFVKPYFLNRESAEKAVKKLSSQDWEVFFSRAKIQKNSLQRFFPFQLCIHAFLVLCVLVYFALLKKWVVSRLSV
ncbi:MAG: hypothetical protein V4489_03235 [Chlamydiota bacterium]